MAGPPTPTAPGEPESFNRLPRFVGSAADRAELPLGGATLLPAAGPGGGGAGRSIRRLVGEHKLAVVGLGVIVAMVLFCYVGPLVYHTNQTDAQAALQNPINAPPENAFPLGTDGTGFDILGRLMYGGQSSLLVAVAASVVATVVGVLWGAVAGFAGGAVDAVMMRVVDILLSIPVLFLLIALVVIFNQSLPLLILVIAFVSWLIPARLVRGEALALRVREYVQAVRVMGGSRRRIIARHIVPNAAGTIIVFATFQVADSILLLAALGFLGFGVPSPQTDWGTMLSNGANSAGNGWWWQIYPAGLCIVIVVVACNFVADALRDVLEARRPTP